MDIQNSALVRKLSCLNSGHARDEEYKETHCIHYADQSIYTASHSV
jgi:hypothetical protein